jgi:hypothetical protein
VALLAVTTPAVTGTLAAPAALSTADTINGNLVGGSLKVINASGSSVNFNLADPGRTDAGNTGTQAVTAVANNTGKWFKLDAAFVDADNLFHTVLSSAPGVTYELIP